MAYLETNKLAGYVSNKYFNEYKFDISPLKLQKTMYLLYAMWGGNARLANEDIKNANQSNDCNNIIEYSQLFDEDLFEPNFEAWKYGPVDRGLYKEYQTDNLEKISELSIEPNNVKGTIINFIDSICSQSFKINDFALVELTHQDKAWQSAYDVEDCIHSADIDSESIISEYAARLASRQ